MDTFLTPDEIDQRLGLPRGRARRLARRGLLPATILPDGTIIFAEAILASFLARCTVKDTSATRQPGGVK